MILTSPFKLCTGVEADELRQIWAWGSPFRGRPILTLRWPLLTGFVVCTRKEIDVPVVKHVEVGEVQVVEKHVEERGRNDGGTKKSRASRACSEDSEGFSKSLWG